MKNKLLLTLVTFYCSLNLFSCKRRLILFFRFFVVLFKINYFDKYFFLIAKKLPPTAASIPIQYTPYNMTCPFWKVSCGKSPPTTLTPDRFTFQRYKIHGPKNSKKQITLPSACFFTALVTAAVMMLQITAVR